MNLNQLKWTKNINRDDGKWAYPHKDIDYNTKVFNLHWKPESYNNAAKPEKGDLAILRQKTRVTHIVEFIDSDAPQKDLENNNKWICRLVKVIWMADTWSEPPHQKDLFDCSLHLEGGNIMKLENIQNLRQRWDAKGGMPSFQKHIQKKLKL